MQKISVNIDNYLDNDKAEPESYQGVQTFIGITEKQPHGSTIREDRHT